MDFKHKFYNKHDKEFNTKLNIYTDSYLKSSNFESGDLQHWLAFKRGKNAKKL